MLDSEGEASMLTFLVFGLRRNPRGKGRSSEEILLDFWLLFLDWVECCLEEAGGGV